MDFCVCKHRVVPHENSPGLTFQALEVEKFQALEVEKRGIVRFSTQVPENLN